jgi:hypothetical protein
MDGKENQNQGISLYEKDGKKWVRINVFKHDFLIGFSDIEKDGNRRFDWESALDAAEELGYTLANDKQWELVNVYKNEVDAVIEENNGDVLDGVYWSSSRFDYYTALLYNGEIGRIDNFHIQYVFAARPISYPDEN